jgi:hypothetical protein
MKLTDGTKLHQFMVFLILKQRNGLLPHKGSKFTGMYHNDALVNV